MNVILVVLGLVFAVGLWGYFYKGDPLYVTNRLSASDIAGYASGAGFQGNDLVTAVAIALAESGGDPNAHGDTNIGSGTGSVGLWQINLDSHPEYANVNLYDPSENAAAAFSIYTQRGRSFTAWSTYTGGQYQSFLEQANGGVSA
jgi:hypothetical protein